MAEDRLLVEALSGFVRTLVRPYDVEAVLAELNERVTALLDLAGSGVSLLDGDSLEFVTARTPAAAEVEQVQQEHQQGPCVEAARGGVVVVSSDLSRESSRWPQVAAVAARHGILAVAGIPLTLGDETVGVLNLYAAQPREWSAEDLAVAGVLADMATTYLINASTLHQRDRLNDQLKQALESRVLIEQAKGITANDRGIDVDAAFQLLRRHARNHNTSLRKVCEAVVTSGLRV